MSMGLTRREQEVLALVGEGLSNKEIARRLGITDSTVKVHLHSMYTKLTVNNRVKLALLAALPQQENL